MAISISRRVCFLSLYALLLPPSSGWAADQAVIRPFNGKDLTGWKTVGGSPEETLKVGTAKLNPQDPQELIVEAGGSDLVNPQAHARDFYTEQKFGSATIELEFMVPRGSNSGIYVMGEYEIQILDSYGRDTVSAGDLGGLYGAQAPSTNAAKAPGEWQKFVITFRAPQFDAAGNKTGNALFQRIVLNGQVIHENVEMQSQTPGGLTGKEQPTGPLMFQGNHGAVAFRNIRITPQEGAEAK